MVQHLSIPPKLPVNIVLVPVHHLADMMLAQTLLQHAKLANNWIFTIANTLPRLSLPTFYWTFPTNHMLDFWHLITITPNLVLAWRLPIHPWHPLGHGRDNTSISFTSSSYTSIISLMGGNDVIFVYVLCRFSSTFSLIFCSCLLTILYRQA